MVCPSTPARAYGLLLASIRDPDPVLFLEPVRIYRYAKQEVANDGKALPLDVCFLLREGTDVTIVTWGAMTVETLKAATQLAAEGISAEVIDLAVDHVSTLGLHPAVAIADVRQVVGEIAHAEHHVDFGAFF